MKKWKKFLLWWIALGFIGLLLDIMGFINLQNRPTDVQKKARDIFIADWDRLVAGKADITNDTIVVYVPNEENPFLNPDDYAGQYHPRLVNGQSCAELNIDFIQVRALRSNKLLSGISCKD